MGRRLFDLLLLLNLIAFLWGSAHQVPLAPPLPPLPEGVPRLQWLAPAPPSESAVKTDR